MARLKSTLPLALLAAGCGGQDVVGRWAGPFPLAGAKLCETRLQPNGAATVQCDGTALVAAGRYQWDGSRLTVALDFLTRNGKPVRAPEPFAFRVRGAGNVLHVEQGGRRVDWRRKMR